MEHTQHSKQSGQSAHKGKSARVSSKHDAIALLTEDHKRVKKLFKEFEKLCEHGNSDSKKKTLVEQICQELTIHAQVEEELFYPAARDAIHDEELLDEADVEHASAKDLIQKLQAMQPSDDHYDATVMVLSEYINHHVKEEEGEIFPKLKKAKIDTKILGDKIEEREGELKSDSGNASAAGKT